MADDPYDPFDDFNRFHALGVVRDPYPRLAELRREGSIHKLTLRGMCGQPDLPWETGNTYSVLTHDAATRVLLDGETFSSAVYARSMGRAFGRSILEMDEPEHSRYRGLIQKAFTKSALDRWEHELVRPIVNRMIDRFATRGRADLVRELTFPFPVSVIAGMIGLDEVDLPAFHRMATEALGITVDQARGIRASQGLREMFARVLPPSLPSLPGDCVATSSIYAADTWHGAGPWHMCQSMRHVSVTRAATETCLSDQRRDDLDRRRDRNHARSWPNVICNRECEW